MEKKGRFTKEYCENCKKLMEFECQKKSNFYKSIIKWVSAVCIFLILITSILLFEDKGIPPEKVAEMAIEICKNIAIK